MKIKVRREFGNDDQVRFVASYIAYGVKSTIGRDVFLSATNRAELSQELAGDAARALVAFMRSELDTAIELEFE